MFYDTKIIPSNIFFFKCFDYFLKNIINNIWIGTYNFYMINSALNDVFPSFFALNSTHGGKREKFQPTKLPMQSNRLGSNFIYFWHNLLNFVTYTICYFSLSFFYILYIYFIFTSFSFKYILIV